MANLAVLLSPLFWGAVIVMFLVGFAGGCQKGVEREKRTTETIRAEFKAYTLEQEARFRSVAASARVAATRVESELVAANDLLARASSENRELIERNRRLAAIRLTGEARVAHDRAARAGEPVRVRDDPVGAAREPVAEPAPGARQEAAAAVPAAAPEVNLQELLLAVEDNYRAHWACVRQVEGWQAFYDEVRRAWASTE